MAADPRIVPSRVGRIIPGMSTKRRSAAADYAVYLAVRVAVCVIQAMPMRLAFALADGLAKVAYLIDKRHREVAAENLTFAFPEKSPAEINRLVRGCYRHCLRQVVEMVLLPRKFHIYTWRRYGRMVGGKAVLDALLSPRPTLIVTAHFGNWELAGFAMGVFGFRSYAIARVLDNPRLERFLKHFRERTGQTTIAKKDEFDRLAGVLQAGGKVATLGDQDAGPRGVFVDFFHRPASAHKAVALMALQFDAVMVVVGVPRIDDRFYFHIHCEDAIDPREYADRSDAVTAITQRYHDALARLIRRHPEQYFWLHRRWKSRPQPRKKTGAAATA